MTITLTSALLQNDGIYFCAIKRDGVPDILCVVPGMDNAPDNDTVLDLVKKSFVDTWSLERFRALVTSVHPHIAFSLENDKADARAALVKKIEAARFAIKRDSVRYKVAHAALNGDTIAQGKLYSESEYRFMTWQKLADEIISDEHGEERRSFAISGIAAAGLDAISKATTETAVVAARDAALAKLRTAVSA